MLVKDLKNILNDMEDDWMVYLSDDISGHKVTKHWWIYPVQDESGNIWVEIVKTAIPVYTELMEEYKGKRADWFYNQVMAYPYKEEKE